MQVIPTVGRMQQLPAQLAPTEKNMIDRQIVDRKGESLLLYNHWTLYQQHISIQIFQTKKISSTIVD